MACMSSLVFGCGPRSGTVELAWQFVDRGGDPIFPGGVFGSRFRDVCDRSGRLGEPVTYDLGVELEICDPACEADLDRPAEEDAEGERCDPGCEVVPALRFSCETYRGSDLDVPPSDQPYRFTLRALVEIDREGASCPAPEPTCIAVPGPRERTVRPGLVTDLQVYQIAVDLDLGSDDVLDLERCGCA